MSDNENKLKELIVSLRHSSKDAEDLERQKGLATAIFAAALAWDCVDIVIGIFEDNPGKSVDEMYDILDREGLFPKIEFTED